MKSFLVVSLAASGALATYFQASNLLQRDLVEVPCSEQGRKDCGTGCILLTDTCCPDQRGGCHVGTNCWMGDNGQYACCPIGKTCSGPGGVITYPGGINTVTISNQPPTTTAQPPVTTEEPAPTTTEQPSVSVPIITVSSSEAVVPTGGAPNATVSSPPVTAGVAAFGLTASTFVGGALAGVFALFF